MTTAEKVLLRILPLIEDQNEQAIVLQNFIAENGPLSEDAAQEVRSILKTSSA